MNSSARRTRAGLRIDSRRHAGIGQQPYPTKKAAGPAWDRRLARAALAATDYEPPSCVLTLLNVVEALVPTAWMAVRQTTMIRASMTAYSTAVGPSSETRKRLMLDANGIMMCPFLGRRTENLTERFPTGTGPGACRSLSEWKGTSS